MRKKEKTKKLISIGAQTKEEGITLKVFKDVLDILMTLATVASAVLCFCTLKEMQTERTLAYLPCIQLSSEEYVIHLSDDSIELSDELDGLPVFEEYEYADDSMQSPILILDARNIGVGTAKEVTISISSDAAKKAVEVFNESSLFCDIICDIDPNKPISIYDLIWLDDITDITSIPYILPNAEEAQEYSLPTLYYSFIYAMLNEYECRVYSPGKSVLIPDIEILITYSDVFGITYRQNAYIHTEEGLVYDGGFMLKVSIVLDGEYVES